MGVGQTIKRLREEHNLTQMQLAKMSGVPQSSLSLFETGEREISLTYATRLASALGVSPLELLWEELGLSGTSAEKDYTDPIIEKTAQLMEDMPPEKRREVFNCAQEKKLLTDLLKQKAE